MSIQIEMPKYRSHKIVWALKIKDIKKDGEGENRETDGSAIITPEEERYAPFHVDAAYMQKHKPEVGGYYVRYEDGYLSYSPAEPFEAGNTRIDANSAETPLEKSLAAQKANAKLMYEDLTSLHIYLDGLGVPNKSPEGNIYSPVERLQTLEIKHLKNKEQEDLEESNREIPTEEN